MKKRLKILIIFLMISIVWCLFNINDYLQKKDWITTTAEITFVGLPDGVFIGAYTDINNCIHKDVTLYVDFFCHGARSNVDKLIGKEVMIVYNPLTGEVDRSNLLCYLFSIFFVFLFSVLIFILKKQPNKV